VPVATTGHSAGPSSHDAPAREDDFDLTQISGYQFSTHLPTGADNFLPTISATAAKDQATNYTQGLTNEPFTDPREIFNRPDEYTQAVPSGVSGTQGVAGTAGIAGPLTLGRQGGPGPTYAEQKNTVRGARDAARAAEYTRDRELFDSVMREAEDVEARYGGAIPGSGFQTVEYDLASAQAMNAATDETIGQQDVNGHAAPLSGGPITNPGTNTVRHSSFAAYAEEPREYAEDQLLDLSQRYQAAAILNEYDLAARKRARQILESEPAYASLEPGSADYYATFDRLVHNEKERFYERYGPPVCAFDGMTRLPILSLYGDSLRHYIAANQGARRYPFRRHSMAFPPAYLNDPDRIEKSKRRLRRLSLIGREEYLQRLEDSQHYGTDGSGRFTATANGEAVLTRPGQFGEHGSRGANPTSTQERRMREEHAVHTVLAEEPELIVNAPTGHPSVFGIGPPRVLSPLGSETDQQYLEDLRKYRETHGIPSDLNESDDPSYAPGWGETGRRMQQAPRPQPDIPMDEHARIKLMVDSDRMARLGSFQLQERHAVRPPSGPIVAPPHS